MRKPASEQQETSANTARAHTHTHTPIHTHTHTHTYVSVSTATCVAIFILVTQSCLTLWNPRDCSPPGSSVHGFLQTRILEWVVIPLSRVSFQPRDRSQFCIPGKILYHLTPDSRILAWRIPGTEEPDRLPSMGSHRSQTRLKWLSSSSSSSRTEAPIATCLQLYCAKNWNWDGTRYQKKKKNR